MAKDEEYILELANGRSLRSDWSEDGLLGEYVRLCDENGEELVYWHNDEWQTDPVLVMGAILGAANSPVAATDIAGTHGGGSEATGLASKK